MDFEHIGSIYIAYRAFHHLVISSYTVNVRYSYYIYYQIEIESNFNMVQVSRHHCRPFFYCLNREKKLICPGFKCCPHLTLQIILHE